MGVGALFAADWLAGELAVLGQLVAFVAGACVRSGAVLMLIIIIFIYSY